MKIRFFSDIHEEFVRHSHETKKNGYTRTIFPGDKDDVLVLAGDIDVNKQVLKFVESFTDQFRAVIFCLGNHDLWVRAINVLDCFQSELPNVHLLHNSKVEIDDVVFLGGTLWTDYSNANANYMCRAQQSMVDFKKIKIKRPIPGDGEYTYSRIWAKDILAEHVKTRDYIENQLTIREPQKTYVVVTHHAPSYESMRQAGRMFDSISPCYYSDLDHIVEKADYWIHGHTHDNVDYEIGKCRVMTNQLGYRQDYTDLGLCDGFDINKYIVIK